MIPQRADNHRQHLASIRRLEKFNARSMCRLIAGRIDHNSFILQRRSSVNDGDANSLQAKVETARIVVDRLVSVSTGFESDQWMEKFRTVQTALAQGRLKDAIVEEARLTSRWTAAKWIVSRELAKTLEKAMGVLCRQVHYPNHVEPVLKLGELPNDVAESGTVADESERIRQACREAFKRDPLECDDRFAEILRMASERAHAELASHRRGMGFCHVFWGRKKKSDRMPLLYGRYNLCDLCSKHRTH